MPSRTASSVAAGGGPPRRRGRLFMSAMLAYFAMTGTLRTFPGYKVANHLCCDRNLGEEGSMADSVLPFNDRDGFIWYDGRLIPWRDAKLHVLTHGLHYASCV